MTKLLNAFSGKKTYIVMIGTVLAAVGGYMSGEMSGAVAFQTVAAMLTAGSFRSALNR